MENKCELVSICIFMFDKNKNTDSLQICTVYILFTNQLSFNKNKIINVIFLQKKYVQYIYIYIVIMINVMLHIHSSFVNKDEQTKNTNNRAKQKFFFDTKATY